MTDDPDDDPEPTDAEELDEIIAENREKRKEQVSFEWVETVREAGEVYRETEAVEDVASELDLSIETTREALTVYRLIFQERSESAIKSARVGRAYFSLSRDAADQYDPEAEDEPLEELLCEYVGALYLDHDIDETPVGDPLDESTPPTADVFAELDTDKIFQFPTAVSMIPDGAISDAMITQSEVASIAAATGATEAVQQDIFNGLSASIGTAALPEGMMAMVTQSVFPQNLSKIIQFSGFAENIATTASVFSGLAEAAKVSQPPPSLFADLATARVTAIPTTAISGQYGGGQSEGFEYQPQPDIESDKGKKEQTPTPEIEDDEVSDLEPSAGLHTEYPNWEARFSEAHIEPPRSVNTRQANRVEYQTPIMTAYKIVSEGETYQWLSSFPRGYQIVIIGAILYGIGLRLGMQHPGGLSLFAPAIRTAIFGTNDDINKFEK